MQYNAMRFFIGHSEMYTVNDRDATRAVIPGDCEDLGYFVHNDTMHDELVDDFKELEAEIFLNASIDSRSQISWPEELFVYVKFGYDRTLKNQLENVDKTDFPTWVDNVMTHVQTYYRHASLPTKIQFKVPSFVTPEDFCR